jgi:hypothetical protein
MLGRSTTAGAVLLAVAGGFLPGVRGQSKSLMGAFTAVSLLAFVYLARVRP